jgi:photosynthetic reaction center cytochrome c subunit
MNRMTQRSILCTMASILVCFLAVVSARGQAAQAEKPLMADDVFTNIQVLRGLTLDEFMGTMGFLSASLGLNCSGCHDLQDSAAFANDNPRKQTARRMILMVNALNNTNFGGKREVTCYSCHRGDSRPKITPSLLEMYSVPPDDDPNEVEPRDRPVGNSPTVDQIFDKYIQALGGAQKLAGLTSFVARGTYEGYDTVHDQVPVDVYAKSPNQRTVIVHVGTENNIRTYDGRNAWNTSAGTLMPVPVFPLTSAELAGARLDASLSFPGQIKQLLSGWRTGFPAVAVDDHSVDIVQGDNEDGTPVKFYFDKESGLLLRQVRFTNTVLGFNPVQIDYADYRDVSGIKFPFKLTTTWTDGQTVIELSELRVNAPVDAARFAKPTPPPR